MIVDAAQLADRSTITARVVVIGGGVVGIALSRQLADAGLEVAMLESGGLRPEAGASDLYAGSMTVGTSADGAEDNDGYLTASRVRCLGGAGNVWGGKCGPLDPIDFEKRAWVPYSGWPVDRAALEPFYDRACALLELPRFRRPEPGKNWPEPLFEHRTTAFAPRTRAYTRYTGALADGPFQAYKDAATNHPRITVYLNANVTNIGLRADGRRVESLTVRTLNGRTHTAQAASYVLATGGIENVRLLLASNTVVPAGIGNHSDWLGRAFQGHTTVNVNPAAIWAMKSAEAMEPYDISRSDGPHTVLGFSDGYQTAKRQLNVTMTLAGPGSNHPATTTALKAVTANAMKTAAGMQRAVYLMIEHPPNRDSRITLSSSARDALGMPRVQLEMRHQEAELAALEEMIATVARELGRCRSGRLQWSATRKDWIASMKSLSRHHMGATRMASSPSDGVVDEHCAVHGVGNLHIAGSSVFPTSGLCNPTLTLLALAFRLGDRLIARKGETA